ncbi:hypothetical protein SDC9_105831 [bioreactor metagenome]|uniref:Lysoplasmalogenase n=1 Tax=bioreactor metagenome TaxID=1076179 RepID=A0A645BBA8_9ZZZZ
MIMKIILLIIFSTLCILNVLYEKNNKRKGIAFTKPFLMPLLAIIYLSNAPEINYSIVLALSFGFLGDVFLLKNHKQVYVLAGIISFLIGHLFYIYVFISDSYMVKTIPLWFLLFLLPYAGIGFLVFKKLITSMQSMKLPAVIYMCILCTMSFMSFSRIWSASFFSFILTFLGSLCFLVSDSILAFDIFSMERKNNGATVMETYIAAQILIIIGLLL